MAAAGNPNAPPIDILEKHGLTEAHVHCDIEFPLEQLERVNAKLRESGQPPFQNRKRQLRWATPGETGDYWEFQLEAYILAEGEEHPPTLHLLIRGHQSIRGLPRPHLRSTRTIEKIRSLVEVLSHESLTTKFDCDLTWHSSAELMLLPDVLPLNPRFPDDSVIQEISGVIGRSADGTTRFIVDRSSTEPVMFHVSLNFQHEAAFTPNIVAQAVYHGSEILEKMNMWGN